jgi:hypothetical protein
MYICLFSLIWILISVIQNYRMWHCEFSCCLCLFNRDNKNENQDDSIWLKEKWSIGEVCNTFIMGHLIFWWFYLYKSLVAGRHYYFWYSSISVPFIQMTSHSVDNRPHVACDVHLRMICSYNYFWILIKKLLN